MGPAGSTDRWQGLIRWQVHTRLITGSLLRILAKKSFPRVHPPALFTPFSSHRPPWASGATPQPLSRPLLLGAWTTLGDQMTAEVAEGTRVIPTPPARAPRKKREVALLWSSFQTSLIKIKYLHRLPGL